MAKKKWIAGAIKRPGIEKRRAAAAGISTQEELSRDAKVATQLGGMKASLGKTLTRLARRKK